MQTPIQTQLLLVKRGNTSSHCSMTSHLSWDDHSCASHSLKTALLPCTNSLIGMHTAGFLFCSTHVSYSFKQIQGKLKFLQCSKNRKELVWLGANSLSHQFLRSTPHGGIIAKQFSVNSRTD